MAALRKVLAARHPQPGCEQLVFLARGGRALVTVKPDGKRSDRIIESFRRLAVKAGIHRPRLGFYWLRHTFQTEGDNAGDQNATASIMGHVDDSMSGHYRESISDERLRRVTDHVRKWLFGAKKKK